MSHVTTKSLVGSCHAFYAPGGTVSEIHLVLDQKLESYRKRNSDSKFRFVTARKLKTTQHRWLAIMRSTGATKLLAQMQKECALEGVCIRMSAQAKRNIRIRDHKDVLAAIDHQILDGLVNAGVLVNDDSGNLEFGEIVCEPTERYLLAGRECLLVQFARSHKPCRETVTKRVRTTGWPDPLHGLTKKQREAMIRP